MLKLRYYILRLLNGLPKWHNTPNLTGKIIFQDNFKNLDKWEFSLPWYTYPTTATINNGILTLSKGEIYIENIKQCCRIQVKLRTKNLRNYIFLTAHKWDNGHKGMDATSFKKWPTDDWNIYEIEVTKKCIKWYLNGLLVKKHKKYLPIDPYYFILSASDINAAWLWSMHKPDKSDIREYDIFECYANTPIEFDWVKIYNT